MPTSRATRYHELNFDLDKATDLEMYYDPDPALHNARPNASNFQIAKQIRNKIAQAMDRETQWVDQGDHASVMAEIAAATVPTAWDPDKDLDWDADDYLDQRDGKYRQMLNLMKHQYGV